MRIAFIVNNYPPRVGGVELHVRNLATHLRDQGHIITVITLSDQPVSACEEGIEVIRLPEHLRIAETLGFPPFGAVRRVARILRERAVEVVSVHTRFFPMTWVGLRSAKRVGAVVIHTEHGSDHVVSNSAAIALVSRLVDHTVGRYVLLHATSVVGVSENVVAFVQRLSGRANADVFYNAINPAPDWLDRTRRDHVVFVGRLVPGKGADVFIEMLALLEADGRSFTAEVLGDGPGLSELAAQVSRAGLDGRVVLRGRVEPAEVSDALAGAILVNPSTLAEGFQTTLLEALEVGGSVVSYDVPGAALLRSQGFPVDIVEVVGARALADAVQFRLDEQWRAHSMDEWYWSARAAAYARHAQSLVR